MALKRILIIHPDPDAAARVAAPLHRTGEFATDAIHNGFDAALKIFSEAFDGLILHMLTPGIEPIRVVQRIRQDRERGKLGILILHRGMDSGTQWVLKRSGVNLLLSDPPNDADLVQALRVMTGLQTMPVQAKVQQNTGVAKPGDRRGETAQRARARPSPDRRARGPSRRPAVPPAVLADEILRLARRGLDLPGMPPWVSRLDFVIGDTRGDLVTKDVVALDLNLAATILRTVNSIYYRGLTPIACLARALGRLGQRDVARSFVVSWTDRATSPEACQAFILEAFWRHNLLVACLAEDITRFARRAERGAAFSAGLLHDVGKLFLMRFFEREFLKADYRSRKERVPLGVCWDPTPIERDVLGTDHGTVGYELCRGWALPPVLCAGTLHHQIESDRVRQLAEGNISKMVALADMLAHFVEDASQAAAPGDEVGPNASVAAMDPSSGEAAAQKPGSASERVGVAIRGLHRVEKNERQLAAAALPKMSVTAIRSMPKLVTPSPELMDEFLYTFVPPWVHEFIKGIHLPLGRIVERAERRVSRATKQAGLAA